MKRKQFIFATLLLVASTAFAQYESANIKREKDYSKLENQVGKEYWVKANPKAIQRQKFKKEPSIDSYGNDVFVVTSDAKFKVVGFDTDRIRPHLKVVFEDGKEAYIEVSVLWDSEKREVLGDVFDGSAYFDFIEYFFKGKPDEVLADFKRKKKRAAAEYKAKGGVRIGMTKEQVLKSNWGKPSSINKSIGASGASEQWVYGGGNYLYFKNGVLTTIQN
jgi:hypothetical protein